MLLCFSVVKAELELLIVGGSLAPVKFVVLPFSYEGSGLSPAVAVEDYMVKALSSTGLFSMPYRYDQPENINNMMAWQFTGIRYVLQGRLVETEGVLTLRLSIDDSLGLQPTISSVILNPDQLALSSQMYADQVYRSLFYATFTNDTEKQYLANENPTLTRYLNQLVLTFKNNWHNTSGQGTCQVKLQQLPGGLVFKYKLNDECLQNQQLSTEIEQLFESIQMLPYDKYQSVFSKNLSLQFITH